MRFSLLGGGGSGAGLQRVADATARTALTPTDGLTVLQLDTDEIWVYDGVGAAWLRVAGPLLAFSFTDSSSIDFTYTAATQELTAALKLSAAAAGGSDLKIGLSLEADGLLAVIQQANGSQDGYLTQAKWSEFTNAASDIANHLASSTAHDANEIVFAPGYIGSTLVATNVQAAIEELDTEVDARLDALEATSHAAVTLAAVGSSPNSNGATLTGQVLNLEPADSSNPGVVSTSTQTFTGAKTFSNAITAPTLNISSNNGRGTASIANTSGGLSGVGVFFERTVGLENYVGFLNSTTRFVQGTYGSRVYRGTPTIPTLEDGDTGASTVLFDMQGDSMGMRFPIQNTARRTAMGTPANYTVILHDNSTVPEVSIELHDSAGWKRIDGTFKSNYNTVDNIVAAGAPPIDGYNHRQIYFIAGSGGAVTGTDFTTSVYHATEVIVIGTSDTNTVTFEPSSTMVLNGTITLGDGDSLHMVFNRATNKWYEIARNA